MAKIYYLQSNDGMILETSNPEWYEGYKKLTQKEGAALHKPSLWRGRYLHLPPKWPF